MHILYICRNIYSTPFGILYCLYYKTTDFVVDNDYLHTPYSDQDTDMWFLLKKLIHCLKVWYYRQPLTAYKQSLVCSCLVYSNLFCCLTPCRIQLPQFWLAYTWLPKNVILPATADWLWTNTEPCTGTVLNSYTNPLQTVSPRWLSPCEAFFFPYIVLMNREIAVANGGKKGINRSLFWKLFTY